jgi:AcrR family transcriptional regulator
VSIKVAWSEDNAGSSPARGRPRDPDLEARVLTSALQLIAELGLEAATMDAIAERSGVARATLFRRWTNRDALIEAAIRHAIGRQPIGATGDLELDIRRAAEQARAIVSERLFQVVFPEIARELLRGGSVDSGVTYHGLFPGRRTFADEYGDLAEAAGFRTDIDPYLAVDLLAGAHINRLLATGQGPSAAFGAQVLDVVLTGIRKQG